MKSSVNSPLGATYMGKGICHFLVWAPRSSRVDVHFIGSSHRFERLEKGKRGYHHAIVHGIKPGDLYKFRFNKKFERPDPASRFQPQSVHHASQVINPLFEWKDTKWKGIPLEKYIIYELHIGSFTSKGNFVSAIQQLDKLKELGITAIELMPIAQNPGERNWGYDVVYPFAVQNSYGGPHDMKKFIYACHQKGLAVIVDAVYNHLGPEGNYLLDIAPYFTDRYRTPWGSAINYDGPLSDEVRRFFLENALYWINDFHIDALRLDAVQEMFDSSARHILSELAYTVHQKAKSLRRKIYLFAECDLNDPRILYSENKGGYNLDAQWNDDFHHSLHTILTGESNGYYKDFGKISNLACAFKEGFVYKGQYSPFRKRRFGTTSSHVAAHRLVVFSQNHDQVGNRKEGERLGHLISFESLKLTAGTLIFSPAIPLLFMGEEYGETNPFQYFVHHSDPSLIESVRRGRKWQLASLAWKGHFPDPQSIRTFKRSKLKWEKLNQGRHKILFNFYKALFQLRRSIPALKDLNKNKLKTHFIEKEKTLLIQRWKDKNHIFISINFSKSAQVMKVSLPPGYWKKKLDSQDKKWGGPGQSLKTSFISKGKVILHLPPESLTLYVRG